MRPSPSLTQYLLRAALAATLLPMLVMVSLSYGQYREDVHSVEAWAGDESQASARLASNMLDFVVDDARDAVREARSDLAEGHSAQAALRSALSTHPQIESLALTDASGRVVATTIPGETGSLAAMPHFKAVAAGDAIAYGQVTTSATLHRPVLPIAVPVADHGRFGGMLVARLNTNKLSELLFSRLGQDGRAVTYVTDGAGRLIADPDPDRVQRAPLMAAEPVVKAALAGRRDWMVLDDARGRMRVAGVMRMPATGWVVVASRDAGEALSKAHERLFSQLVAIGLITVLAGLFAWWGGRWLATPLSLLTQAMSRERKAHDTLHDPGLAPASVPSGVAEFESLAVSYNALVAELNHRFEQLAAYQQELQAQNHELQEQTEELAHTKAFNEMILNSAGEGIFGTDLDGCITFANPAAARMLDMNVVELLGVPLRSLVDHGRPNVGIEACPYHAALRDDAPQRQMGTRFRRKDGSSFPVEVSINRIVDGRDDLGTVVVFSDITARLEAERAARLEADRQAALAHAQELEARNVELARLSREAQAANKLKSEFLANMSHELRTPLNSIIGYTEVVLMGKHQALEPKTQKHLEVVLRNGRNLLALINDVLDLSKVEAGKTTLHLEPVDPRVVLAAVSGTTEPLAAAKGLTLAFETDPALGVVETDDTKVRQIVLNLVSNAIKFTKQGSVHVRAERRGDDRWAIVVTDTGIGIAPDHQQLIFEAFRQVDASTTREVGGTGLGLAIARKLARLMGGDVTVESHEGEGATFTLNLPRTTQPPAPEPLETLLEAQPDGRRLVLAIDDDAEALQLIVEKLKDSPYTVIAARSADEGIRLAKARHPFAITLDVLMPEKDGWAVLRELRADPATADIPVLVLSFLDNQLLGFALGASAYLTKPVSQPALLDTLAGFAHEARAGHVLVVDDDADTRALYRQVLEQRHWRVQEAPDGDAAVAAIAQSPPAVVLLDLMMPRMDGFEVMAWLRAHPEYGHIPVVVLTAKELSEHDLNRLTEAQRLFRKGEVSESLLVTNLRDVLDRTGGASPA